MHIAYTTACCYRTSRDNNLAALWRASRPDGRFRISNLPAGSYVVEVTHPRYSFESIRVDINSRGKCRARRLNRLQPSQIDQLPYPLRFVARQKIDYFQKRNSWIVSEALSNPTVCRPMDSFCVKTTSRRHVIFSA